MSPRRIPLRLFAWTAAAYWLLASSFGAPSAAKSPDIIRSDATRQAVKHALSADDQQLLDAIERGCFNFLWREIGDPSGFVKDRRLEEVASLAGVGFQLSAIPIGVERG